MEDFEKVASLCFCCACHFGLLIMGFIVYFSMNLLLVSEILLVIRGMNEPQQTVVF